jgi:hypothetical protein
MSAHLHIATLPDEELRPAYLIGQLAGLWREQGHRITVGPTARLEADVGMVHIDRTRVSARCVPANPDRRPLLNESVLDISKRRAFVFDLNFRIAASTPQVLLHDAAVDRIEGRITESWSSLCQGELAPALEPLLPFARSGRFIPTRLSEVTPASAGRSLVTGMIVGGSKTDLIDLGAKLQRALIAAKQ